MRPGLKTRAGAAARRELPRNGFVPLWIIGYSEIRGSGGKPRCFRQPLPGRDERLTRNGCIGNATTAIGAFNPNYTQCVKYTGCPAAYPVIWCALPGVGHNNSSCGGLNYSPGLMWRVLGALP